MADVYQVNINVCRYQQFNHLMVPTRRRFDHHGYWERQISLLNFWKFIIVYDTKVIYDKRIYIDYVSIDDKATILNSLYS